MARSKKERLLWHKQWKNTRAFEPLLAPSKSITDEQLEQLNYPVMVSPKLDGVRCLVKDGVALSRSLKPLPNKRLQAAINRLAKQLDGFDGELVSMDSDYRLGYTGVFHKTTSVVMSHDSSIHSLVYVVFDNFLHHAPFFGRRHRLGDVLCSVIVEDIKVTTGLSLVNCKQVMANNAKEATNEYLAWLEQGYEGAMIRGVHAPYYYGRTSFEQQVLLKLKGSDEATGKIIGILPQMENTNEAVIQATGRTKRSTAKAGKIAKDTAGSFVLATDEWGEVTVGSGEGLTAELRKYIWEHQEEYIGRELDFRYMPYGTRDKPRQPVFLRISAFE